MIYAADKLSKRKLDELFKSGSALLNYELLIRYVDLETAGDKILEASYETDDFMKKDALDRFLDFVFFKVQTGYIYIYNLAYPLRRMSDEDLEEKVSELINEYLYPEIVLKLLKIFARNLHDSDSNLSLANLITSEAIIRSIYETYLLFKKDIFNKDLDERALNVKRIQQFSSRSDNKLSSPLDAAARFKYILEFFMIKMDVDHIFSREDIMLSKDV